MDDKCLTAAIQAMDGRCSAIVTIAFGFGFLLALSEMLARRRWQKRARKAESALRIGLKFSPEKLREWVAHCVSQLPEEDSHEPTTPEDSSEPTRVR